MSIIDLVSWSPPQNSEKIYAYKFPHDNLATYTQLLVHESQEAVFFSKGKLLGKFGPGKHTLSTENLPLLRDLFGIPFGGKNPFTAQVWFVNKTEPYNLGYTINRINVNDANYGPVFLMVNGQYGLKIVDSENFLIKLVGTNTLFTKDDITSHFKGEFDTKVKSLIVGFMKNNEIGYMEISAHLEEFTEHLKQKISPLYSDFGLELKKFYVSTIDIDETTAEGKKLKEAIVQQQIQRITGRSWQQEAAFNTANNAIDNLGSGGGSSTPGIIGAMMAMNMMGGMGGGTTMANGIMGQNYNQPNFGANTSKQSTQSNTANLVVHDVYCSNCSKKYQSTMKFCPHCGDPYCPCPKCGTDNDPKSKRCVSCGVSLVESSGKCPQCQSDLPFSSKFCPNCGFNSAAATQNQGNNCTRCGNPITGNSKFCPTCGQKR
jgi:membrane protease subunit (stomatin/prohibitin family)